MSFDDLQDPYGIAMWPEYRGRDGCRTPMVWDADAPNGGFGGGDTNDRQAQPWLPVAPAHLPLAAEGQRADAGSLFQFYRAMLAWRRGKPGIVRGGIDLLPAHDQVLAFVRDPLSQHGPARLCAFNLSNRPASFALPAAIDAPTPDTEAPTLVGTVTGGRLELPPYGAVFATL